MYCGTRFLPGTCFTMDHVVPTVISMHLDWNHAPQHPKKAMTNVTHPAASSSESADTKLYCGTKVAYPE